MGKSGLLDLENHFAFYGAYHSNPINILIHSIFVWPNFFTTLLLFYFTPPLFDLSEKFEFLSSGFLSYALVFNFGLIFTLMHVVFYICLDRKAGTLAALLCLACWAGASSLAIRLGSSLAWKVALAAQVIGFSAQFTGHGVFEKRAPALMDNFLPAYMMAPFFALYEVLRKLFGYEPYPGFRAKVDAKIEAEIKEWEEKKLKKVS